MPGCTFTIRNRPNASVEEMNSRPVSTLTAWTLAPGTMAPVASDTVPTSEPYSTWADAGAAPAMANAANRAMAALRPKMEWNITLTS